MQITYTHNITECIYNLMIQLTRYDIQSENTNYSLCASRYTIAPKSDIEHHVHDAYCPFKERDNEHPTT